MFPEPEQVQQLLSESQIKGEKTAFDINISIH